MAGNDFSQDLSRVYQALSRELKAMGILWQTFVQARTENPELLNSFLGKKGQEAESGRFIYLGKNLKYPQPLLAIDGAHVLVVMEENAEGFVLNGCVSPEKMPQANVNASMEVILRPGAKLKFISMKNSKTVAPDLTRLKIQMDNDSVLTWIDIDLGKPNPWQPQFDVHPSARVDLHRYDRSVDLAGKEFSEILKSIPPEYAVEIKAVMPSPREGRPGI